MYNINIYIVEDSLKTQKRSVLPSSKVQWVKDFTSVLEKALSNEKECIVIGNFNYDILKSDNYSKSWLELMDSMNFDQLVNDHTRVTSNSATLIDHVFSNIPLNIPMSQYHIMQ